MTDPSDAGADGGAGDGEGRGGKTRREDAALLTGQASFTDDLAAPGMVHLAFVRSEEAHARIEDIDAAAARELDGVVAVYTFEDVADSAAPGVLSVPTDRLAVDVPGHPVLARERVRYHGQPVAAVVAEDRYRARDGARAVEVTYDPLDAVVDPRAAADESAPTIFDGAPDNVALTGELGDADAAEEAFADADHVVELDLENNRLQPSAMETRAALARRDGGGDQLVVEMTSQSPHGHRSSIANTLGLDEQRLRVVAPSVGGGFGHKGHHHPGDAMAAWAALQLDRPVKWVATRSGNALAGAHGRDHRTAAAIAVDDDGDVRGLRVETHAAIGGFGLSYGAVMPAGYGRLLASQYGIPAIHARTHCVFTTTAPIHSYRGAGRPEAIYVTERLVDAAARELDLEPAELRRRNHVPPDDFPHETAVGAEYDTGDYGPAMAKALAAVDYESRREGPDRDERGRYLGVGVACYTESTGGGFESGVVRVHPDGGVTVLAGTHSHGQGHETTYAGLVADELGVDEARIEVVEGDTGRIPQGTGTFGSRSAIVGGNAVVESAREVRAKARRIAARELDADPEAVTVESGAFRAGGDELAFDDVAGAAYGYDLGDLDRGLEATTFYEPDGTAYTFGTHAAAVAVDPSTGEIEIEQYVAVDDCGERIDPGIVEGQVHGGVAQGIGQARYEQAVYGADGTLATAHLRDYAVPRAFHLPEFETDATVTPSDRNDLGVKGIGEAGTIAAPPTVVNAVVDALAPLGVEHLDMPLTDERVWQVVEDAREE